MLDTYEETQSRGAYQAPTQPAMPITAPHQALPGYLQTPPTNPRRSNRMRTGAIVALSLVLLLVLAVGVFAGWQFGRTSTTRRGNASQAPDRNQLFPLTGNNDQAVREAVLAKVRPAVVEVNVTTQQGEPLGQA